MSRAYSARRDRPSARDTRYEDPYASHGGFAAEPRRYIDDSAYARPRRSSASPAQNYRSRDYTDAGDYHQRRSAAATPSRWDRQHSVDGPLRRESTQRPRRRTSPSTGTTEASTPQRRHLQSDETAHSHTPGYQRRVVEPHTSARRQRTSSARTPHPRSSEHSTALVVVDENVQPAWVSPHRPRRGESADGTVDTPPRATAAATSPRRSARATPRPARHSSRNVSPAERSRSTKRRDAPKSGRSSHTTTELEPQGTGRYVSPKERRHRHSSRGTRSSSRRDNSRRSGAERSRSRHQPRADSHRSRDSPAPAPVVTPVSTAPPPHPPRRRATNESPIPSHQPATGSSASTFLRPPSRTSSARGSQLDARPAAMARPSSRRSSAGIEVLGISHPALAVSGQAPGYPTSSAPHRAFEPTPTPKETVEIREKIHETKGWINDMRRQVERDVAREERHRSRQRSRHASATRRRSTSAQPREAAREEPRAVLHHAHPRASAAASTDLGEDPRAHRGGPAAAVQEPARAASGRRSRRSSVGESTIASAPRPVRQPQRHQRVGESAATASLVTRETVRSLHTMPSTTVTSSSRGSADRAQAEPPSVIAAPPPPPPPPPAQPTMDTAVNSTMEEDPIFSFPSFLDGNTYHTTAALCQYNVALAESLSDEQLEVMRETVFDHDEVAFAELLYGDDIQAELSLIDNTFATSTDPKVRYEMRRLQAEAVQRFIAKCSAARNRLLSAASGSLADAVRQAAVGLDRVPYGESEAVAAPY